MKALNGDQFISSLLVTKKQGRIAPSGQVVNLKTFNYFIKQHFKIEHKEITLGVSCKGHWFFQTETETNIKPISK